MVTLDTSSASTGRYSGFRDVFPPTGLSVSPTHYRGTDGLDRISGSRVSDATGPSGIFADKTNMCALYNSASESISPGQLGCALSHFSLYRQLLNESALINHYWIWEDDAVPCDDFVTKAQGAYGDIGFGDLFSTHVIQMGFGSNWDLGSLPSHETVVVNRVPGKCTHCYAISKTGATRVLDFVNSGIMTVAVPIDSVICFLMARGSMAFYTSGENNERCRKLVEYVGGQMGIADPLAITSDYDLVGRAFWKGVSAADQSAISTQLGSSEWCYPTSASGSGTFSRDRGVVFQNALHESAIWTGHFTTV